MKSLPMKAITPVNRWSVLALLVSTGAQICMYQGGDKNLHRKTNLLKNIFSFSPKDMFIDCREKGRGRERNRCERNIDQLPPVHIQTRI